MVERGVVIGTGLGTAQVRMERSESCEGCHGCLYSESGKYMVSEVADRIGVLPGDIVKIETQGMSPLAAVLLLFVLPLVMLAAGYAAGSAIAALLAVRSPIPGIAAAAVFFFGSYGVLFLVTRRSPESHTGRSSIVEILGRQQDATE
jgi:positive regulator of sigma E activity